VICLDEWGPLGLKYYPAPRLCPPDALPGYTPDYGGRGSLWVFGAFEPASGFALTQTALRRTRSDFIGFLDAVVQTWTEDELILIMDNLSVHKTLEVRLWALAHQRVSLLFQPTYAPWLNLIEPWWKILRSLSIKGRGFTDLEAMSQTIYQATDYWNDHAHPFVWRKSA
jgi:transposase